MSRMMISFKTPEDEFTNSSSFRSLMESLFSLPRKVRRFNKFRFLEGSCQVEISCIDIEFLSLHFVSLVDMEDDPLYLLFSKKIEAFLLEER